MYSTNERRAKVLEYMNARRRDTIGNLAFQFGVSRRTMINDIQILSRSFPIYALAGRYGGGVYITEEFFAGRKYLTAEQAGFLKRIISMLNAVDRVIAQSILTNFAEPGKCGGY